MNREPENRSRPVWMPAIGLAAAILLTATSVGVLVAARQFMGSHRTAASGARVTSPSPIAEPGNVQLSAPSTDVVWTLVNYDHLYRSTDQGSHWEQRPMPASFGIRPSISFIDASEGWLLAPESAATQCQDALADVWHTRDGGATWQQLPVAGLQTAQCKELIHFPDARHGFISAWDANHQPTVYFSFDGGVGWKRTTLPDPPDFKTLPGGYTLRVEWIKAFGNKLYLEAYGSQGPGSQYPDVHDRQYIFTLSDGGGTWTWKQKVASRDVAVITESRWLEINPSGHLDETVNGGQQFHSFESNLAVEPTAARPRLVFVDANAGYAVGGMNLQRTTDGGSNWTRIGMPGADAVTVSPPPTPSQIPMPTGVQLSAPSEKVVWALVADSYLFRSTNYGYEWELRNWLPHQGGGYAVISFVDDTRGWALLPGVPATQCAQAGAQVWQTTDGAATWHIVTTVANQKPLPDRLTFAQCKDYMAFTDSVRGFVAGHDAMHAPIISRTVDGGVTWAQATLPDPPGFTTMAGHALRVVQVKAFGAVLLAEAGLGDGIAYMFRSADGGATWSHFVSVPSGVLNLALVTETRWLLIGNDGQGKETMDAGKSWHAFRCNYQDAAGVASTFVFASPQVGYGTVRGGVQLTPDGGSHWKLIKTSWP